MNAKPAADHRPVDRRRFLTTAATGAALSLSAQSYARVAGSGERISVAFLGCGARAQAHIHIVQKLAQETRNVQAVAVCDVWDGLEDDYDQTFGTSVTRRHYAQGLYPSARKCGLNPGDRVNVVKDYRRLLEQKHIDAVCIATPDHWHARMSLDALAAGKDVIVETPMTRTPAEARAVAEAAVHHNRVVSVGAQGLSDTSWRVALDRIRAGTIGPVVQMAGGVFRNDARGYWRFYRVTPEMNPSTIDWDMFLGHRFDVQGEPLGPSPQEQPFDRALFAQWRCYRPFSSGPFSDLLTPLTTKFLAATGLQFPARVNGSGGLTQELDGRTVPDLATIVADFAEGSQMLLTATTLSSYPCEEVIRGRRGTIKFVKGGLQIFRDDSARASTFPARLEGPAAPSELVPAIAPRNETEALWQNFLDCIRKRDRNTFCPAERGAAAVAITAMGAESCQRGVTLHWGS